MSKKIDLNDNDKHPGMVRWFSIPVLLDAARRSIISSIFGSYADRRLVHAALNVLKDEGLKKQYDYSTQVIPNDKGEIWIDYVSDLGDGFDSTYAIAYLLAQKNIVVAGNTLPRGHVLVMGGDEVYPTATKKEYARRLTTPYSYALPNVADAEHPLLFMILGNHDWYDGLTLFLAKFCRGVATPLGGWRINQSRSYFAVKLPGNWWIWGLDTQLGEDIDKPQAEYFEAIAESNKMEAGHKVILCGSVPTWLTVDSTDEEEREKFGKGIDHVASVIIKKKWPDAKIYTVLSGDKHHYSRYTANLTGTEFITSGGGGAFLHLTHNLKDQINGLYWAGIPKQHLTLAKKDSEEDACYPSRKASKKLALGNWKFLSVNWGFCFTLGTLYSFASFIMMMWRKPELIPAYSFSDFDWFLNIGKSLLGSPIFYIIALSIIAGFVSYADHKGRKKLVLGAIHGFLHVAWITGVVSALPLLNTFISQFFGGPVIDWYPGSWSLIGLLIETIVVGGFGAGIIWGLYLVVTCYGFSLHCDHASSAMALNSYKNFLRIRIKDDDLTIYPIGLEKTPERDEWRVVERDVKVDQKASDVEPIGPLGIELIEAPILIKADGIKI